LAVSYPLFVAIGSILMLAPMLYVGHLRRIPVLKIFLCCIGFTVGGAIGVRVMHFIENGNWDGRSFFGALFIAPPFALLLSVLLKLSFDDVSDMCPAAISAILAVLKYKCYLTGCCFGKVMHINEIGEAVRFPSQLTEFFAAIVLMIIFLILARTGFMKGSLYGLYMLIYGIVRFVLNLMRETTPFFLGMAAGNFWSVISVLCGVAWILIHHFRKNQNTQSIFIRRNAT